MSRYRNCDHCSWEFVPRYSSDMYCNLCRVANNLPDRSRNERKREMEREHLREMLAAADQKRQRQKDELIASVNAALADADERRTA